MPVRSSPWLAFALAAPLLVACAGDRSGAPKPAHSYALDEARASFRGIALGDAESRVTARFGSDRGKPDGPAGPVGEDGYETGTPGTFASTPGRPRPDDRTKALRYRGMAFVTNERRVYVIMSSLPGTRTTRRVGVGDDLERARRAYRGLSCKQATDAHGGDAFPYCLGRLDGKHYLYFGGDPIGTVAIAEVPLYGG
jgi:hypothetical protein